MGIINTSSFVLAAPVGQGGTLTVGYPTGSVQADFTDARAHPEGEVVVNDNDIYLESNNDVDLSYGASVVTVTNNLARIWPAGATIRVQLAFTEPTDVATTEGIQAALDEIVSAGGGPLIELQETVGGLADGAGVAVSLATAADLRTDEAGTLFVTPEAMADARVQVTLVLAAGNIAVDGTTFETGHCVITTAAAFTPVSGISDKEIKVFLKASGAARVVTAPGILTMNFGAGVSIPDGKWGLFVFVLIDGDPCCVFGGYTD